MGDIQPVSNFVAIVSKMIKLIPTTDDCISGLSPFRLPLIPVPSHPTESQTVKAGLLTAPVELCRHQPEILT